MIIIEITRRGLELCALLPILFIVPCFSLELTRILIRDAKMGFWILALTCIAFIVLACLPGQINSVLREETKEVGPQWAPTKEEGELPKTPTWAPTKVSA